MTFAVAVTTAAAPVHAAPPPIPEAPKSEEEVAVDSALAAWEKGNWIEVRGILDPMVQGGRKLKDPVLNEQALRHLADATLSDDSLDQDLRSQLASTYIDRLLADDPQWRPPEGIHNASLYSMAADLRAQRDQVQFDECLAERAACAADREDLQERYEELEKEHIDLKKAYSEQEVEVRETVARNRAVALVPFGVGHFYNGNRGLGAAFLASEVIFGGLAIGIFAYRRINCTRNEDGILDCDGRRSETHYVRVRNTEQVFGWAILGALAADIIVAQILFKPYKAQEIRRVKRSELSGKDARPPPRKKPRKRRNKRNGGDKLQARPVPTFLPGGGGMGVSLRF